MDDALHAFDEITNRNTISWNICLKGFIRSGQLDKACQLFDEIQQRDVVSWNSMVSGFVQYGHTEYAFELFSKMQNAGIRPNGFTYSILTSIVSSISHGKEIHGSMIRSGVMSFSVVPGNSLISMYGDLGLLDYAFGVFFNGRKIGYHLLEFINVWLFQSRLCRTGNKAVFFDEILWFSCRPIYTIFSD